METPDPNDKAEWKPNIAFRVLMTLASPFMAMVVQAIPSSHHDGFWTTWGDILAFAWFDRDREVERKAREVRDGVSPEDDRP